VEKSNTCFPFHVNTQAEAIREVEETTRVSVEPRPNEEDESSRF